MQQSQVSCLWTRTLQNVLCCLDFFSPKMKAIANTKHGDCTEFRIVADVDDRGTVRPVLDPIHCKTTTPLQSARIPGSVGGRIWNPKPPRPKMATLGCPIRPHLHGYVVSENPGGRGAQRRGLFRSGRVFGTRIGARTEFGPFEPTLIRMMVRSWAPSSEKIYCDKSTICSERDTFGIVRPYTHKSTAFQGPQTWPPTPFPTSKNPLLGLRSMTSSQVSAVSPLGKVILARGICIPASPAQVAFVQCKRHDLCGLNASD